MIRMPIRLILSIIFATLGLTLLIWSFAPPERVARRQVILPEQMQVAAAVVPETRLLTLEYPAALRVDESDRLRLTFDVQQQAQAAGIPNVYETHQVIAESHLDMAGMNVRPTGTVSEPVLPGQRVTFFWSVRPGDTGKAQGTVWLYLHFIPKDGGTEIRRTISAQTIEIDSNAFFGLKANATSSLGVLGCFTGVLLGFSFFVNGIKWVVERGKTTKSPSHEV